LLSHDVVDGKTALWPQHRTPPTKLQTVAAAFEEFSFSVTEIGDIELFGYAASRP
jgi:hypothetical protein